MVNINNEFPSNYLKAADLQGQAVKVKVKEVVPEDIGSDRKLVIYFDGKSKGMVLNKTNARTIADVFGDETENWTGAEIEVFAMKVDFQGRMVDGLRVRVPPPPRTGNVMPNARDDAMAAAQNGDGGIPYDDEVPF